MAGKGILRATAADGDGCRSRSILQRARIDSDAATYGGGKRNTRKAIAGTRGIDDCSGRCRDLDCTIGRHEHAALSAECDDDEADAGTQQKSARPGAALTGQRLCLDAIEDGDVDERQNACKPRLQR